MPRTPILDREVFLEQLPDGTLRELDFAVVNTTLGAGVEPRPVERAGVHSAAAADGFDEKFENTVNRFTTIRNDGSIEVLQLTNGLQTPRTW